MSATLACFCILLLLTLGLGATASSHWQVIGPGGGGAQFTPTISPQNPDCVLVACDMTGAYITHDAGASWRMFNLRTRVSFFAFDPRDPKVIYAGASGLWRSKDTGKTWTLIYPAPQTVTGVGLAGDHGETHLLASPAPASRIVALAVDPADSQTLYAVMQQEGAVGLYLSTDGGATWSLSAPLTDGGRHLYVDAASPRKDRTLYVVGTHAIAVREGGNWRQGATLPDQAAILDSSLGFVSQGGKPVAYAITRSGLFVSEDGCATWNATTLPGTGARFVAVATSLHHPDVAYVSYHRLQMGVNTWFGVARSADRGHTWQLVWQEDQEPAANIQDAWVTERFGPGWGENPLGLGVAPNDPDLCYGTDYGRTLRTKDGGKTWQAVYSQRLSDGSYTSTGLDVTTCYGVHFDPFHPERMFITYTDIGLFRSENGGRSWVSSTQGVPRRWVNTTYWMVFDPEVPGRVWAVMSGTHDLPRPKMWRRLENLDYHGGICRSDDGGKTWQPANTGMPETAATHILLDPRSPVNARVLYVTGFGQGVYKSTDGGQNWALKNNGIKGNEPFAWRLAQDSRGVLYLVVARRSDDGSFGNEGDGAVYRSEDGAEHWTELTLPPGVNGPNGLVIDPTDPTRLYLAAWARTASGEAKDGGIFLSTDRGATWKRVLDKDQFVYDVTLDPRDPRILYACGFSSSAWRSTDRGQTWERIRGYNFKWGHRVIPDPRDPQKLYVTTFGGSVWSGPAAGDPSASEDIAAPPALTYSR
jgi:photosystem II stability/assembly factor-like uncharacterized protein